MTAKNKSLPYFEDDDFTPIKVGEPNKYFKIIRTIPEISKRRVPKYLPGKIRRSLIEADNCQTHGLNPSALMNYRKCLEGVIKDMFSDVAEQNLAKAIRKVAEEARLPGALADWITEVRHAGNEAAHDIENDPSADEVAEIREFTVLFLTCLYEVPKRVEHAKGRRTGGQLGTLIG